MIIDISEFSPIVILQKQREISTKDVIALNSLQRKGYENTINNWKVNGKKGAIPEPPGSYRVDEMSDPRYPDYTIPEVRFHSELPVCDKYSEPVDNQIYTAVVGPEITGFTPSRYQSLDILPIGTQGYAPDGKLVTKVGVLTPFGNMVWYQ